MLKDLPQIIQEHLDLTDAYLPPIGFSPETMYLLPGGYDGKPAVLKFSERYEVYEEGVIYQWLNGKLPVPEVYLNAQIGDTYYLIVSLEAGEMLSECFPNMSRETCLETYGTLLKRIHEVNPAGFPFCHDKAYKMEKVRQTILHHAAKTQYFERELLGKAPEMMYDYLVEHQAFEEDLVFCHGDVCFPNFLLKDGHLQAVLDVSGAGVNDRHLDLAIALRTLRYNFEMVGSTLTSQDMTCFLKAYGHHEIDMEKIKFYIFLDELTNG